MGHRVYGCGRSRQLVEQLNADLGSSGRCTALDVRDWEAVQAWAREVIADAGAPDLLLNNAALINRNANFVDIPTEEFDAVIDVNIKGVANVMRAFLPAMLERKTGVIVNMSSGWGRSTSPEVSAYCSSKWAIEGLTQSIAQELPRGMAAIPLSPNTVDTEMLRSAFGSGAASSPSPAVWAHECAQWLLELGPRDNGRPISAPA